jgi:hypothetical protein
MFVFLAFDESESDVFSFNILRQKFARRGAVVHHIHHRPKVSRANEGGGASVPASRTSSGMLAASAREDARPTSQTCQRIHSVTWRASFHNFTAGSDRPCS